VTALACVHRRAAPHTQLPASLKDVPRYAGDAARVSRSWQIRPASAAASAAPVAAPPRAGARAAPAELARRVRRPELLLVCAVAALLNVWALSRNGWANDYYSAAVRSMASSWHNFLFASLDPSGVMTVDKPPLALWVQALSVRAFGYHPLSILLPQALTGVVAVALLYDLVQRRFGRLGGFLAGLALALTPITVAVSRHNNPDALLALCCVAALWCTMRAFDSARRAGAAGTRSRTRSGAVSTRWLVLAGVCVGLGFETKMGAALVVVPGIALAWLWCAPAARRGASALSARLHALRQLLWGGLAMLLVGGAWPLLVELTPASQRPWVSGTSNNTILSLILEYNGAGRVDGQTGVPGGGAPGGGANTMFGGSAGPLRLLNAALGGQAGWLLGFALAGGIAILMTSRLRPRDGRTGWLIATGGAFLTTAVLFSFASGIFHPYYVSLLAPFAAALVGAGAAELIAARSLARALGPFAILAGVAVELVVRSRYPGQLPWLAPVLIGVGVASALVLVLVASRRARIAAVLAVTGALLLAPAVWALDTLGYATSSTFPSGGPQSTQQGGFGGGPGASGGPGRSRGPGGLRNFARRGGLGGFAPPGGSAGSAPSPQLFGGGARGGSGTGAGGALAARGGPGGSPFGSGLSSAVTSYVRAHGGGTIAVSSQSSAAASLISGSASVAGIGGFSGRESDVSVSWLAQEVRSGKIRWVLVEGTGAPSFARSDTRTGSRTAMTAAARACIRVALSGGSRSTSGIASSAPGGVESASGGQTSTSGLYDCRGRAAAIAATAASVASVRSA
jgi:4-amino-4-deoxy-L-arabinose transferase-like glycosyltransferase